MATIADTNTPQRREPLDPSMQELVDELVADPAGRETMSTARDALAKCLQRLGPDDHFERNLYGLAVRLFDELLAEVEERL